MPITSAGVGSGLDINGIVSSLISAERLSFEPRAKVQASIKAKISQYGAIRSGISTLTEKLNSLKTAASNSFRVENSNTGLATVTASRSAIGFYDLDVTQLNKAQKVKSDYYADSNAAVGEGTLQISFGSVSGGSFNTDAGKAGLTLNLDSSNNSLASVRDQINAAGIDVTAAIISDSGGSRLVLEGKGANAGSAFKISVSGDIDGNDTDSGASGGLSALAYDPVGTQGAGKNLTTVNVAQDSQIVVNGTTYSSQTREFKNIEGGINVTARGLGKSQINVTDTPDSSKQKTALKDFVTEYNTLINKLKDGQRKGAVLDNESVPSLLERNLRSTINKTIGGAGLGSIALDTNRDGTLKLSESKLDALLEVDPTVISKLFADQMVASDSRVKVNSFTKDTLNGTYSLNATQAYDSSTSQNAKVSFDGAASALGNKNVVSSNSGGSKGLNITVDEGVTGNLGTVTVTRGLATELENFLKGLDETNGLLKNRTESLQSSSGRIDKEKVRFEDRLDKMQGRLFRQFTQLDLAVSKSQQLNSYVSQQLQALQFSMLY